jgi:hypothetical protein
LIAVVFVALAAVGFAGLAACFALGEWCDLPACTALAVCGVLGCIDERRI